MPKQQRYRKRRSFKRRRGLGNRVRRLARIVRTLKPEVKYSQGGVTSHAITNDFDSMVMPTDTISVGPGYFDERIGDQIRLRSFRIRGHFTLLAGHGARHIRMIAFFYKGNPDSVVTTPISIGNFIMDSVWSNTNLAPYAFYDWHNNKVFDVVYDKLYFIQPNNQLATPVDSLMPFSVKLKIPNARRKITFYQGGSEVVDNKLFVMFITNADSRCTATYNYRMTYTDA